MCGGIILAVISLNLNDLTGYFVIRFCVKEFSLAFFKYLIAVNVMRK